MFFPYIPPYKHFLTTLLQILKLCLLGHMKPCCLNVFLISDLVEMVEHTDDLEI